MRYLKLFENFNSSDLVQNIENMFIDLNDEYIDTNVDYNDDNYSLEISIATNQVVLWSSISGFISRIVNYLKSEDFILCEMFIDGDETIYPEKTINKLSETESGLSSIILIFLERDRADEVIKSREKMMKQFTDAANKRNLRRSQKGFK